jgi:hypothetical protein
VVVTVAVWWLGLRGMSVREPDQLLNAAINIGGILAGFTMTSKSVLVAAPESSRLRKLSQAGAVTDLLRYMMRATYTALGLVAASAVLLAAPKVCSDGSTISMYVLAAWCGFAATALLTSLRVAVLFGGTIRERSPGMTGTHAD